jgi:hypothetical protein
MLGMVAYNCYPKDSRNLKRGISWSRLPGAKIFISKIITAKRMETCSTGRVPA